MHSAAHTSDPLAERLARLCDKLRVPVSFADPARADTPLIYANPAFTRLTGWEPADFLGRNCRFLQGPETDRTTTDEMAQACAEARSDVFSLLNYRRDGTKFMNVVALRTFQVSPGRSLIMGCQMEYRPLHLETDLARHVEAVGSVIHLAHDGRPFAKAGFATHDLLRLDALRMMFQTTFAQAQNGLILGTWRVPPGASGMAEPGGGADTTEPRGEPSAPRRHRHP